MTVMRDVYLCLLKAGEPLTARQITDRLGIPLRPGTHPTGVVSGALHDLARQGYTKPSGRAARGVTHEVIPGRKPPKDGRGHAPGSKAVLREYSKINIRRLHARMGRHPRPQATTALEQCWGFVPLPYQELQSEKKDDLISQTRPSRVRLFIEG